MIMNKFFQKDINIRCNVYLNDIIIYRKTEAEHNNNLKIILTKLEKKDLKFNSNKM